MNQELNFTIRFKTKDGILVMERKTNSRYFFLSSGKTPDNEFIDYSLGIDCRTKGVRLVSKTISKDGIEAIVAWL